MSTATSAYDLYADLLIAAGRVEMPELFEEADYCVEEVGDAAVLLFEDAETGAYFAWGIARDGLIQITDNEAAYVEAFGDEWVSESGYYFG